MPAMKGMATLRVADALLLAQMIRAGGARRHTPVLYYGAPSILCLVKISHFEHATVALTNAHDGARVIVVMFPSSKGARRKMQVASDLVVGDFVPLDAPGTRCEVSRIYALATPMFLGLMRAVDTHRQSTGATRLLMVGHSLGGATMLVTLLRMLTHPAHRHAFEHTFAVSTGAPHFCDGAFWDDLTAARQRRPGALRVHVVENEADPICRIVRRRRHGDHVGDHDGVVMAGRRAPADHCFRWIVICRDGVCALRRHHEEADPWVVIGGGKRATGLVRYAAKRMRCHDDTSYTVNVLNTAAHGVMSRRPRGLQQ